MTEKKHKKWKIIIISVIAVILVLSAAAAGTYQFYIKPKYADKLIETADKVLKSEEVKSLLESEEIQKILEEEGTKQLLDNVNSIANNDEINKIIQSQGNSENTSQNESSTTNGNNENSENQTSTIVVGGDTQKNTLHSQTDGTSAPDSENKADTAEKDTSISTKDMVDGMKIMSKIDMDKVSGLTSGNATAEEKSASIKYIKDTLTNEEIAKAIELMAKYKETLK